MALAVFELIIDMAKVLMKFSAFFIVSIIFFPILALSYLVMNHVFPAWNDWLKHL